MLVRVVKPSTPEAHWRLESPDPALCGLLTPTEELLALIGDETDCYLDVEVSEDGWSVLQRISIH